MAKSTSQTDNMQDVPIFLRKTYELIRTCDPAVACWSDDGETFIVKDPGQFETVVIPQFFKHNKFTSFVRQLNFYSFRKIKFIDSIRIDPKLEAETANYWRFRHENFRRDRPDLLSQIKRMNSAPRVVAASAAAADVTTPCPVTSSSTATATAKPNAVVSAASAVSVATDKAVTTEVQILKKRIEEMNKNIGELTAMVQKVDLKQKEQEKVDASEALPGTKRKKVQISEPLLIADSALSGGDCIMDQQQLHQQPFLGVAAMADLPDDYYHRPGDENNIEQHAADLFPDGMVSSMDLDEDGGDIPALPMPEPMSRDSSDATRVSDLTRVSDIEFVDQLLNAFGDEEATTTQHPPAAAAAVDAFQMEEPVAVVAAAAVASAPSFVPPQAAAAVPAVYNKNLPDPELMQRLGEALMLLPKDIQEMIVDRLIAAITCPNFLQQQQQQQNNAAGGGTATPVEAAKPSAVVPEMPEEDEEEEQQQQKKPSALSQEVATPLAAATLAALLHHYSAQMSAGKKVNKSNVTTKSLPVIPVHA